MILQELYAELRKTYTRNADGEKVILDRPEYDRLEKEIDKLSKKIGEKNIENIPWNNERRKCSKDCTCYNCKEEGLYLLSRKTEGKPPKAVRFFTEESLKKEVEFIKKSKNQYVIYKVNKVLQSYFGYVEPWK